MYRTSVEENLNILVYSDQCRGEPEDISVHIVASSRGEPKDISV